MFGSLKNLIDSRLGKGMVIDDFINEDAFFIKVPAALIYSLAFFLKNDPDVRLTLLDQIIALPPKILPWPLVQPREDSAHEILYQFKSIKLPYRVTLVVEAKHEGSLISLVHLYAGALFHEEDLQKSLGLIFEEANIDEKFARKIH